MRVDITRRARGHEYLSARGIGRSNAMEALGHSLAGMGKGLMHVTEGRSI